MRKIRRSSAFKRDYKRVKATPKHMGKIDALLVAVLDLLLNDRDLPFNLRDHSLSGNWAGYRECHLRPDLLLVYSKPDVETLYLVRLGSHSELFTV